MTPSRRRWRPGRDAMRRRSLGSALALAALLGVSLVSPLAAQEEDSAPPPTAVAAATSEPTASAASLRGSQPDIVVIYMDDFSPLRPDLWCDAERTPTLADFCAHGVWFEHAIGSTPLCCPGRANVLSGRYGHRNGITSNDMSAFSPKRTIATKLQGEGYRTGFFGKYLNGLRDTVTSRRKMRPYTAGWDRFDVIWENQGRFYDYRAYTKDGNRRYGRKPRDHSSRVAGLAAAGFIREAPADEPLFALVSLYDGHQPFSPMKRFEGHPACRDVEPWRGPAFNEQDVSDKPAYVRNTKRLRTDGFDLRKRCRAAMTVDWVAREVREALAETGRLDDALLVFTADNGYLYGDHRQRNKFDAYSTPVPLYLRWPAVLGDVPRTIGEPVSNIDLPRTFCALGGCTMPRSDGRSLLPLLDGSRSCLDREYLYEEMLHANRKFDGRRKGRPGWYGVRSTLCWSETRWVYTEYEKGRRKRGERELYDLTNDPHQLQNLAGRREHAATERALRRMLKRGVVRPNGVGFGAKLDKNGFAEPALATKG